MQCSGLHQGKFLRVTRNAASGLMRLMPKAIHSVRLTGPVLELYAVNLRILALSSSILPMKGNKSEFVSQPCQSDMLTVTLREQ